MTESIWTLILPGVTLAPSPEAVLADRLRALRQAQRLTQARLARALGGAKGISVSAISSWENSSDPKLPPAGRLRAYALFCARDHSAEATPQLGREEDLNASEREKFDALYQELIGLRDAARKKPGTAAAGAGLWTFEAGPVTIICPEAPAAYRSPLADEANPNHTRMYRYADVDALIELWGHLRARNPELEDLAHKLPEEAVSPDLTGHLIVLGGIVWNDVAHQLQPLMRDLPIQQVEVPDLLNGEVFRLPDGQEFRPQWGEYERTLEKPPTKEQITADQTEDVWRDGKRRGLLEDVAFLARVPNPLNHTRTLTVCSGVYSRGVVGAVRALTDIAVRERNEAYLASRFPGGSFALLLRVPLVNGAAMSPDLEIPYNRLYEWSPDDEAVA
ncbi:helix-turn-helix domain-containing protein [Kribbella albertanoniae]|uniref:helix-turn-helix domain-containing protein n=1 Tax=Kribbella albertanoniae TaxID=1266829 RepID=UPI001404E419|nr:helix-turn-helix transcriptional regulator [Kribbella albertanoniae]